MCMLRSVISDEPEESNPPSVFNSIDASFQMRLKELEEKQEVNSQFCTCTVYLDTKNNDNDDNNDNGSI